MLANGVTEWDDLETGIALCLLISLMSIKHIMEVMEGQSRKNFRQLSCQVYEK